MQTNQQLSITSAVCQPRIPSRWPLAARVSLALACAIGVLVSWGFVVSTGAAAPLAGQQVAAPQPDVTRPVTASWTDFQPTGWVNSVPFASSVTADDPQTLLASTAVFRTSTDGGVSWSAWTQAGLVATPVSSSTIVISVSALVLPDSQSGNRIQFRIESPKGGTQTSPDYVVRVDTVAPGSPLNLQSIPDTWTHLNSFRETWTNPADTSGVVGAYYRLDSEPQSGNDGIFVDNPNQIDGIAVPAEGTHSLLLWLVDEAGNVDHRTYRVDWQAFKYDATPPTVGVAYQGPLGQNGWYTGTVTVTFAPADLLSGIDAWGWRLDGQALSTTLSTIVAGDASHTVVLTATDRAGNSTIPVTQTLRIDAGQPLISHAISSPPTASGWYTAPITVTLSLTDPVSGPDVITWRLDNSPLIVGRRVVVRPDGIHSLSAYGRDQAGNRSTTLSLSLPLDSHSPVTQLALTPAAPGAAGFYSHSVAGQWSASDALTQPVPGPGSGVVATRMKIDNRAWQSAAPFTLTATGIHRVQYASQDLAGNREITRTRVISIDTVAPGAPLAPSIQPDAWSANNQFTLSWQNPADTSGIVGTFLSIGQGPPPAGSGAFYPETSQIHGLAAPGEGVWPVWMALRDAVGNRGTFSQVGVLRYDGTRPQLGAQVTGPAGQAGWFVGPTQVSLDISDAGSGPAWLRYRVDDGQWQQTTTLPITVSITGPGKHVVDFSGQDQAGLIGGPAMRAVRIDGDPPGPPIAAAVTPETWTPTNAFTVTWRNPLDTSGVAVAHYSTAPPATPQDGQSLPAAAQAAAIQAPAEGVHDLYLWLEDVAGNSSTGQSVQLAGALRFDATPPTITVRTLPAPNSAGWHRTPVLVELAVDDTLSGVAGTTWQLDGQPPVNSTLFSVSGDGVHTVLVESVDAAGNVGQKTEVFRIDTQPPSVRLFTLASYSASPEIDVKWDGADTTAVQDGDFSGSGLASFDVEVRQNNGAWESWRPGTTQTQATYHGQRGQLLAFRVRSVDLAGNKSAWTTAGERNAVFVDPVVNGAFGTQNWNGWNTIDGLQMAFVQDADLSPGVIVPVARLGSPLYQACAASGVNMLPTPQCGDTWSGVSQTIAVPGPDVVADPTLEVWYRIRTYDQITTTSTIWNQLCPMTPLPPFRLVDSFDVTAQPSGVSQAAVLLRDGNRLPQFPLPIEHRDLGWKLATIDMTPYAGQTVTLDFSSHNRLDNRFNTWTDVTGIKLRGTQQRVLLPFVPLASGEVPDPTPVCWPTGTGQASSPVGPEVSAPSAVNDFTDGSLR